MKIKKDELYPYYVLDNDAYGHCVETDISEEFMKIYNDNLDVFFKLQDELDIYYNNS